MSRDVFAMHRRQMRRIKDGTRFGTINRPVLRAPDLHACNRGAVLPDGTRGCWWCWVSRKLGVQP